MWLVAGEPASPEPTDQATAWAPDQLPCGAPPSAIAILIPAPVLKGLARTFARSQPGPRARVRHSLSAWKPPAARITVSASYVLRVRSPFRAWTLTERSPSAG